MRRLAVADPGGGRRRVDRREVGLEGAPLRGAQPAAVVEGLVQLDHAFLCIVVSVGELLLEIGEVRRRTRRQRGAAQPFGAQLGEQLALSVEARRREQRMRLAERAVVGARLEHPREPRLVRLHCAARRGERASPRAIAGRRRRRRRCPLRRPPPHGLAGASRAASAAAAAASAARCCSSRRRRTSCGCSRFFCFGADAPAAAGADAAPLRAGGSGKPSCCSVRAKLGGGAPSDAFASAAGGAARLLRKPRRWISITSSSSSSGTGARLPRRRS